MRLTDILQGHLTILQDKQSTNRSTFKFLEVMKDKYYFACKNRILREWYATNPKSFSFQVEKRVDGSIYGLSIYGLSTH